MRILLALSLLLAVQTVNADDIECKLTWPIMGGKIGSPVFEFDASDIEFSMSSRFQYRLDIGGSIELRNGAWKLNKIRESSNVEVDFAKAAKEREEEWPWGRMARHFPHKEDVVGSIPITATKVNGHWVFTVDRERLIWEQ